MSDTVDQIKERLNIVDVVGSYVKLEKAGASYKAKCPFHNEKTPSFIVSPDRGSYYCFGCGEKGDIFSFVERFEGVDFVGALKMLAEKAGVELTREHPGAHRDRQEKQKLLDIMEEATLFFEKELGKNREAMDYLLARGLKKETIKDWRLGFAPDSWENLKKHLEEKAAGRGFLAKDIARTGLIKPSEKRANEYYDRFRSRIMFPISDASGRVIAFSGRIFESKNSPKKAPDKEPAKYINSPETELFSKSRVLYGFDKAKGTIRRRNYSILVEGQVDLIMCHQAGYTNSVATSGTALTGGHIELLKRISPRIIVAYDADSAGVAAGERAWQAALSYGMEIKLCALPNGDDPADLIKKNPKAWALALKGAKHIISFFIDGLKKQDLDTRALGRKVKEKVLPYVNAVESAIEQAHYISVISGETGIPEDAIRADLLHVANLASNQVRPDQLRTPAGRAGSAQAVPLRVGPKELILRKIIAILFYQEGLSSNVAKNIEESMAAIMGEAEFKKARTLLESDKDKMVFEAEATASYGSSIAKDIDELLVRLRGEVLRESREKIGTELKQAEKSHDEARANDLLKEYNRISLQIGELQGGRST